MREGLDQGAGKVTRDTKARMDLLVWMLLVPLVQMVFPHLAVDGTENQNLIRLSILVNSEYKHYAASDQ